MSKGYERQSFHGYGIEYMSLIHGQDNYLWVPEEQKLALLGMKLFIYMDRLVYAECDTNPFLRSMDQLIHIVGTYPATVELDFLNRQHARLRELTEEHIPHDYSEIIVLSEWFLAGLIRIKSILREMGLDLQEYIQCIQRMGSVLQNMSEQFGSLAKKCFHKELAADRYQSIAAMCMGNDFLKTLNRVLSAYITEDHPWTEVARISDLDTEHCIEALCSLGIDFDFQQYNDEMGQ